MQSGPPQLSATASPARPAVSATATSMRQAWQSFNNCSLPGPTAVWRRKSAGSFAAGGTVMR